MHRGQVAWSCELKFHAGNANGLAVVAVFPSKHAFGSVKTANDGRQKTRARTIDPIDEPQALGQV